MKKYCKTVLTLDATSLKIEFAEGTLCGIFSVLMQGIRHGEEMQSLILLSC